MASLFFLVSMNLAEASFLVSKAELKALDPALYRPEQLDG